MLPVPDPSPSPIPAPGADGSAADSRPGVPVPPSEPEEQGPAARVNLDAIATDHSEVVQMLLQRSPRWSVRWGNVVIGAVALMIVGLSAFVRYPEIVSTAATLLTQPAPVRVASTTPGRVDQVLVSDQEAVEAGTPLVLFENPAPYDHVRQLEAWLDEVDTTPWLAEDVQRVGFPDLPRNLVLGSMQAAVEEVRIRQVEYELAVQNALSEPRIEILRRQADTRVDLGTALKEQEDLAAEAARLARQRLERREALGAKKMVGAEDLEEATTAYVQAQQAQVRARETILANRIEQYRLEEALSTTQRDQRDQLQRAQLRLLESVERIRAELATWRQSVVVEAPAPGLVSFPKRLQAGEYVSASEPIAAIVPQSNRVEAQVVVAQSDAAKLRPGLTVRIEVDGYPAGEFGALEGTVSHVALVPDGEGYFVRVELSEDLTTTAGHRIDFRQEMQARAEIVVRDARLLTRAVGWISELVK